MFRDKNRGFSDFSLTLSTLYHFEVCQKLFILLSDFILNLSTLCHFRKFLNSSSCYYYKSNCQQNFLHNYWNVLICCTDLACLWINYNKARTWYLVKVHIKWFDQRRTQDMQGTWSFGRKTLILPYFCLIQDSGRMCCKKKKHKRLELHFSPDRNINVYHMALIWNWNSEYLHHSHIRCQPAWKACDQIVWEFKRYTAFPYQIPVTLDNMGMVWGVAISYHCRYYGGCMECFQICSSPIVENNRTHK